MQPVMSSGATPAPGAIAQPDQTEAAEVASASWAWWVAGAGGVELAAASLLAPQGRDLLWLLVVLHVLIVAALAFSVFTLHRRGLATTFPVLATLGVAAAGPLGAVGALALTWLGGRSRPETGLLAAWYNRIALSIAVDPVSRFCDNVSTGRTINLDENAPPSYATVIAAGTLVERQNVLGLIARRFHPDYLAVLATALRSPEAVIRVQAAAVAAHIRPAITRTFREAVGGIATASDSAVGALTLMRTLESMIASGLLDESDRRQGVDIVERLGDIVLARAAKGDTPLPRHLGIEERVALEDALERLLLRRRRFAELRSGRSARRVLARRPIARVRRVPVNVLRARLGV